MDVIAVFDIGKTNKKFLLFDRELKLVHQEEVVFETTMDDDGFECDDIERLENWMKKCIADIISKGKFHPKALNITTYGATLMYLDENGRRITPVYNYLKPMPEGVLEGFYERYGGTEEFCRNTASPALGMLNSGLQILWLKKKKPHLFTKVVHILHFPQYLSYLFNGTITSEYTSLGCHTALWDFDNHHYHKWLKDEAITLPEPVSNEMISNASINETGINAGIGIHDSSASLVPYLSSAKEEFILISTGTWCIFMNPFNKEPLTRDQLRKDTLCYMSIRREQVKSSRLFLGHIHDVNVEIISKHFGIGKDFYRNVKTSDNKIARLAASKERYFFKNGMTLDYIDHHAVLNRFLTFDEAYHQFMADLVDLAMESLSLVIPANDYTRNVYISGGFARSEIFTRLLSSRLRNRKIYTSEIDNATALGAAMVVYEGAFNTPIPEISLGLKRV